MCHQENLYSNQRYALKKNVIILDLEFGEGAFTMITSFITSSGSESMAVGGDCTEGPEFQDYYF